MNSQEVNKVLVDTRGLRCPMPLLKLKQALNSAETGQSIELVATDAGSKRDIPAFIALTQHILVNQTETDGEFTYWVTKGDES